MKMNSKKVAKLLLVSALTISLGVSNVNATQGRDRNDHRGKDKNKRSEIRRDEPKRIGDGDCNKTVKTPIDGGIVTLLFGAGAAIVGVRRRKMSKN